MSRFKSFFKNNWRFIIAGLTPILIIAIIFALPLKTVPVPVTETYWATEMKTEPYTATETYTDMEPYITTEQRTETLINQAVGYGGWSQSFKVDKADTTVSIEVSNYGSGYYVPRYVIISDNYSPYYNPHYWSSWPWYWDSYGGYGGGQSWATVRISYPEQVTKYRPVTKTKEVTKYREVPTQVRKERTVTQYVKMSMWESMFR